MTEGEKITVTCKGTDYHCVISSVSNSRVTLKLVEKKVNFHIREYI